MGMLYFPDRGRTYTLDHRSSRIKRGLRIAFVKPCSSMSSTRTTVKGRTFKPNSSKNASVYPCSALRPTLNSVHISCLTISAQYLMIFIQQRSQIPLTCSTGLCLVLMCRLATLPYPGQVVKGLTLAS